MLSFPRCTLAAILITLVGPTIQVSTQDREPREMLSGHWHLVFYGKCIMDSHNLQACRSLQGPATFAVMNVLWRNTRSHGDRRLHKQSNGALFRPFTTSIVGARLSCRSTISLQ